MQQGLYVEMGMQIWNLESLTARRARRQLRQDPVNSKSWEAI